MKKTFGRLLVAVAALWLAASVALAQTEATPQVGGKAQDFALTTPEGQPVRLSDLTARGTVVLVVLRGYPGYQCPYCQKQAHDFQLKAGAFKEAGAELLLVYPGPPDEVSARAKEFLKPEGALPANYHLVVDPDYAVTRQYGLRWDAPQETAYPSTFVIDRSGRVVYRKISHEHGDRTTADEVLAEIKKAR